MRPGVGPYLQGAPAWRRYAAALALFAVVLIARIELIPALGVHSPLLAFILPVLAAAWIFGRGPAVLITVLAPLVCTPLFQMGFRWSDPLGWLGHVTFFALVCGIAIELIHQLQVTHRQLMSDMSEQQRAMDALARSEQRFKQLAEEMKQAQTALMEADRRKDEFLAMLAHELRNPLAPVLNIATLLENKASDTIAVQQMSGILRRQTIHLARLVDDLLDVARITRGKINLKRERLMLQNVIERALECVHPMLIAKSQAIKLVTPPRATAIDGDSVRLIQVLGNLLTNASKFSPEGSTIFLTLEVDEREAHIRVRDQGIGMDRQTLPQIFDLFMQADQSLDRSQGGLGVGLTISKRLVELHEGRIEAHSEGIGRGSEFVITLPLAQGASASPSELRTRRVPARRILVVDDNIDAAVSLMMLLEMEGHDVRTVHDGPGALKLLDEFAADLLLLDIGLPDIDGYSLAEIIRQRFDTRAPKLVAVSGYAPDGSLRKYGHFDAHLTKPVQLHVLLETIERLPERSHASDASGR